MPNAPLVMSRAENADPAFSTHVDDLAEQFEAVEAEQQRRLFQREPVAWAETRLGDTLWSGQKTVLNSVRDNRRTAVRSCHAIGKSYIASVVVGWWLDAWPPGDAFVVTSAPTAKQVEAILWREIGRVHARGNLFGRLNQTEWKMDVKGKEELVAFGRKPDDYDPTAFQGIHALRVLVVLDEACGIIESLWDAADSLIANKYSKMLAIGNPDDPTVEFANVCKPGSGWHVIGIGAFDSPNFTGEVMPERIRLQLIDREYVEEKRRKWAKAWSWNDDRTMVVPPANVDPYATHPFWQSKILGRFPIVAGENTLIPFQWVEAAKARWETTPAQGHIELGVDVGGGGDSSTIALRTGPRVQIIHEDHNPDTMQTCGLVLAKIREHGARYAKVDVIGIGRGLVDRAKEQRQPVIGVNVGEAPEDREAYQNRRAELWWAIRERFESGDIAIDPSDDDLASELIDIKFKRLSSGRIQIESKDEARRRGIASPNRADALMLSFAPEEERVGLTW